MNHVVSVIIPTYNGLELLKKHLPAVIRTMRDGDELVIADDASTDETVSWLQTQFALKKKPTQTDYLHYSSSRHAVSAKKVIGVQLIVHTQNKRFAQTVNLAAKHALGEYYFLLNNDVEPHPDCLTHLVDMYHLKALDRSLFGVGCFEHEPTDGGGTVLGGKNKLWFERGLFVHSRAKNFESGESSWVSGGSGFFDATKWHELSGFSDAYFPAYWEDIDLSYRALQKKWHIWFCAEAVVNHLHESTNQTVFGQRQMRIMSFRHGLVFTWRNGSWWQRLQFIAWLPYHVLITSYRTNGEFFSGFVLFTQYLLHKNTQPHAP